MKGDHLLSSIYFSLKDCNLSPYAATIRAHSFLLSLPSDLSLVSVILKEEEHHSMFRIITNGLSEERSASVVGFLENGGSDHVFWPMDGF